MTVIGRIRNVTAVLARHRDEPAVRGRAAQVAGAALVADGLVGLENPLGERSRAGIVGGLVLLALGLLLRVPAGALAEGLAPYPDGVVVTGTVASVGLPSGDGSSCAMTFRYEFDGVTHERAPGWTGSGFCDLVVGDPVDVSVVPDDAARGRLVSGGTTVAATWIPRAPWLLVALGAWTVLVRAIELAVGVWLLLWGRRTVRATAGTAADEAIVEELKRAWSGAA